MGVEPTRMIIDNIRNAALYNGLGPGIEEGLRYLRNSDFSTTDPGRYDIGSNCFAIVQDYDSSPRETKRWEAHRSYIDIQFVVRGEESIGCADIQRLQVIEEYDSTKDITWLAGNGEFVMARAGTFVVLFPHDAHMPGVAVDAPIPVRKVVVKVPT